MEAKEFDALIEKLATIYVTARVNQKPMGAGDFAAMYLDAQRQIREQLAALQGQ